MELVKELDSVKNVPREDRRSEDLGENLLITAARRTSIAHLLIKHSWAWTRYSLERLPIKMTLSNLGILAVVLATILPRSVTYMLLYPIFRLVFGNLYPAYASYKAVRTKNVKEYVKWMMYWIVFALFTCVETFTDVFFSFWFPFYYEIKTILVVWLLSPATKGSSILYRRFVHPALIRREAEIDEALARATEQGYTAVLHLGSKGVNYATTVLMQTAIKHVLNTVPTTLSELPVGQSSDSAISSLVNPRTTSTTVSRSTRDCNDGVEMTEQATTSRINPKNVLVFSEEETEEEFAESEPIITPPSDFEEPPKKSRKTRKPRKEKRVQPTRQPKSRACKDEAFKSYDSDFSDEINLNYDNQGSIYPPEITYTGTYE